MSTQRPTQTDPTRRLDSGRHRAAHRPRTLHLLDIENLVGGAVTTETCLRLWNDYRQIVGIDNDDHIVAAVADRYAEPALFAITGPIQWLIPRQAPDAADHALTNALDIGHTARRYQRVIIGSGDHHFTQIAERLTAASVQVHQATGIGRCSSRLYLACSHTISVMHPTQGRNAA